MGTPSIDERMQELGKTHGAQSHLAPAQITNTEIAAGAIVAGDIANGAVTAAKIAAAVAGDGVTGGAGTPLTVDCDASLTKTGGTGQQLAVAAAGVLAGHIAAGCKGDGLVAGAGAFALQPDGTSVEISGTNKLQLVNAGVTLAKLANDAKSHLYSVKLPPFVAGAPATTRVGILTVPAGKTITLLSATLSATVVPVDADGTCLVRLANYDGGAAEDELVASWNAEALVAKIGTTLALITGGGVNVLGAGDHVYLELISNSAAIDVNWAGATLTLEYLEG